MNAAVRLTSLAVNLQKGVIGLGYFRHFAEEILADAEQEILDEERSKVLVTH